MAHTGVPVTLRLQALGADGAPDASRTDSVQLKLDDARAEVTSADTALTPLVAQPAGTGTRLPVALASGSATVDVTFASPGHHTALAVAADGQTAGESAPLDVSGVFVAVDGPANPISGQREHFRLTAEDGCGNPIDGYIGDISLTTGDAFAQADDLSATSGAKRGLLVHQFRAAEHGQASIDLIFAQSGAQTITLRDPDSQVSLATLALTVAAAANGAPQPPNASVAAPAVAAVQPARSAIPSVAAPPSSSAPAVIVPPSEPAPHLAPQNGSGADANQPAASNLPPSALDRTSAGIAVSHEAQTSPMTLSGNTSDFPRVSRAIAASVGGVACASTTQVNTSSYPLSLPASCGTAGLAITVSVGGQTAGLQTVARATCLQFQPGTGVIKLIIVTGGTPDTSCGSDGSVTSSAISPSSGPPAGGSAVTITGTGFSITAGATSVAFRPERGHGRDLQQYDAVYGHEPDGQRDRRHPRDRRRPGERGRGGGPVQLRHPGSP